MIRRLDIRKFGGPVRLNSLIAVVFWLIVSVVPSSGIAAPPAPEEVGRWKFKKADRPIKVINLGGSVAAWQRGSYSQFLEAACGRVEIVNRAKARIGARQLKERFVKQVLRNRRVAPEKAEEMWLVFQGGLNSLSTPYLTNRHIRDIFLRAHGAGIKTLGITLGPWGNAKRWRAADGLDAMRRTGLVVDYMMGRLKPVEALERHAKGRETWEPGELPTVAVDMFQSALRDSDAAPLADKRMRHRLRYDKRITAELKRLPKPMRDSALDQLEADARALSKQFMKPSFMAFDSIHPNMEGHRVMAKTICPKLPQSWGCSCEAIGKMVWDVKVRGLMPRVQ